jgi:NAD(P)-dependent dehydrogenase (short-subunit alcohol dehydrogenase family)
MRPMGYWQGKVAIVTGGSSGLGLAIGEALATAGAQVVLAARGAEALEQSAARLCQSGSPVIAIPTDVTHQAAVDLLLASTLERFGKLDALFNCAGRSMRRAVLDTTPDDFRELLDLNLLSVVRTTRAAAPHLLRSQGHLVNVGSLAGKTAARYMGAYPASKFALSAYTQQLRLELGPQGLHVLLVCPGPIERAQPRERSPEELAGLPASAARPGAGAKTKAISPQRLAADILQACERRQSEIIRPRKARLLFALSQLSPALGDWILRKSTSG